MTPTHSSSAWPILVLGSDPLATEAMAAAIDPPRTHALPVTMIQAVARIETGGVDAVVLLPRAVDPTLLLPALRRNKQTRLLIAASSAQSLPPAFPGVLHRLAHTVDDLRTELQHPQPTAMLGRLTDRQLEILQRIADGDSPTEAAFHLGITVKTLNNHLGTIYHRLGTRNGTQAVLAALRNKLISLG